jgi:hypothetical protein
MMDSTRATTTRFFRANFLLLLLRLRLRLRLFSRDDSGQVR